MDPTFKTAFLSWLEIQVNKALELDPATAKRLHALDGAVIEFQCLEPRFHCYVFLDPEGVRCAGWHEGDTDARFKGTLAAFTILAARREAAWTEIAGLEVSGDEALLNELESLHQFMELDWESVICGYTGNIGGHFIADGIRQFAAGLQHLGSQARRGTDEYIREELELAPSAAEVDRFCQDVAQLNEEVERLNQKLSALSQECCS